MCSIRVYKKEVAEATKKRTYTSGTLLLLGFVTDFGVDCLAFPVSTFPLPALVWLVLLLLETLLGFLNAVLVVLFTAALDVFPSEARDTISVFPSENDDSSSDPSKASSSNSSSSSDCYKYKLMLIHVLNTSYISYVSPFEATIFIYKVCLTYTRVQVSMYFFTFF